MPGNGKTLLGRAVAGELACPFYYASGAQVRSKWHGESEQRLRALIRAAREHALSVLFLDEVAGLLPRRNEQAGADNRLVTQFLAEIGGFEESDHVLLLHGATNKPWDLDEAVFRTGRFDEKLYVPPPDAASRLAIFNMHLDNVPLAGDVDPAAWAKRLEGFTGSDLAGIISAAKRRALRRCVESEAEPLLMHEDLEQGLSKTPCSATPELLEQYARFNKRMVQ